MYLETSLKVLEFNRLQLSEDYTFPIRFNISQSSEELYKNSFIQL